MRMHRTATVLPVERALNRVFGAAVVVCLLGVASALASAFWWQASAGLVFLCLGVVLWRQRSGGSRGPVVAVALSVTVLVLGILPALNPWPVLLILITQLVVAFDLGFTVSAAFSLCYASVFAISTTLLYDDIPVAGVVRENIGLLVLLLMTAGLGSLMRTSERSRMDAAAVGVDLSQANEALRHSLSSERDLVLAEERARSARELHDGLGHRLTLVALALEYAQRARDRDPETAWAEIGVAAETNRDALSEMRLWVRALDPPVAEAGVGGAAAFNTIADAFRGTGLDVRVTHRGEQRPLEHDAALFATRFMQEGLTNVLRHATAGRADIEVIQSPHQVRFCIGDDGTGATTAKEGFGRRSLRERAELLGGEVSSGRSSLGGFELIAVVPTSEVT